MNQKPHALTGLLRASLLTAALNPALACANPFGLTELTQGYGLAAAADEEPAKSKEGQCGADKMPEAEHKAMQEGKCGEGLKFKEGRCGATKTTVSGHPKQGVVDMKKDMEGKCGSKTMREGKCGAGKPMTPKPEEQGSAEPKPQ